MIQLAIMREGGLGWSDAGRRGSDVTAVLTGRVMRTSLQLFVKKLLLLLARPKFWISKSL